ncbi:Glucuronoyl esterase catalytic domain from Hypocrea Jecorina [Bisporella sp. PMI_857]|nr:Glucuronoyl esterase catalytic domain from Hypocrea Jecorina [Bisporella sp. PMI_857]
MVSLQFLYLIAFSVLHILAQTTQPSNCIPLPSSIPPTTISKLPDPFTFTNGSRVTTKEAWTCRREEIKALLQRYELGQKPSRPANLTATSASNKITIACSEGGKSISFSVSVQLPSGSSKGPFPAIIALGGASIPVPQGVAIITFNNEEIAATYPRANGLFYTLYGTSHQAGGLIAWAWAVSRIIDALEILPSSMTNIDVSRIGVTGCSRNGKGAIIAGAFDDRIRLTIPQEAGSGGAGCWRIVSEMKKNGTNVEDAAQIVTGDGWFATVFEQYVNKIETLPHDHHMLIGLIVGSGRGLLVIENSGIDYLGPISTYGCSIAGRRIFEAVGMQDSFGFSQVAHGASHCQLPASQQPEVAAFMNRFLLAQANTNTNVFKTDGKFNFDLARWVDWSIPGLT